MMVQATRAPLSDIPCFPEAAYLVECRRIELDSVSAARDIADDIQGCGRIRKSVLPTLYSARQRMRLLSVTTSGPLVVQSTSEPLVVTARGVNLGRSEYIWRPLMRPWKKSGLVLGVLALGLSLLLSPLQVGRGQERLAHQFVFLSNGSIKIGIDLRAGGGIGYLADARNDANVINIHDYGRYLGPAYYSGPAPFGNPHPHWKNWRWNPIGPGDCYKNPARVLRHENDGKTLYVKSIPMQWALNNVPSESTFETWIRLEGNGAHVWNRLTNFRKDRTPYPRQTQEVPGLFANGRFYRLFTYDGAAPFTNGPLRQIKHYGKPDGLPWAHWTTSENWAALLTDKDWGVGIYNPAVYTFSGGFHGQPVGVGGPFDGPIGFIAPDIQEVIDHNIVYEFDYYVILGYLNSIRNFVYAHRPKDTRPDYRFDKNRQHWIYAGAGDDGFPLKNGLHVTLRNPTGMMVGPDQWWPAKDVPRLYIRAAHHAQPGTARLFWRVPGVNPAADTIRIAPEKRTSAERSLAFPFKADGNFHTYELDLASVATYQGTIGGLRFEPISRGQKGESVEVKYISWRNYETAEPTIPVAARP
jgi:hypothetical protein